MSIAWEEVFGLFFFFRLLNIELFFFFFSWTILNVEPTGFVN